MTRLTPVRFFVWLALFVAAGAAFLTLSQRWFVTGFALIAVSSLVHHGAVNWRQEFTSSQSYVVYAVVFSSLVMVGVVYWSIVNNLTYPRFVASILSLPPAALRGAIAVSWAAAVIYIWRRTFASASGRSA
jgi:hypothetical protein